MSEDRRERLGLALQVQDLGMSRELASCAVGVHVSTLSRWRCRQRLDQDLVFSRGPRRASVNEASTRRATSLVRELHGLVGAESLAHSVAGLSRRAASSIKAMTCTAMERERRSTTAHVEVAMAGVLRAFDGMDAWRMGHGHLLVAADGHVPYRTSWSVTSQYDGAAVAQLLTRDFDRYGAPLVLRLDRARQHSTPAVQAVLDAHGVMALNGPPHRPQYYGQLERQNREHRAWLKGTSFRDRDGFEESVAEMMRALNERWRRSTLGWHTATEAWSCRPSVTLDRTAFRRQVEERAGRIVQSGEGASVDLVRRLAIEHVLTEWGLLRITKGGGC